MCWGCAVLLVQPHPLSCWLRGSILSVPRSRYSSLYFHPVTPLLPSFFLPCRELKLAQKVVAAAGGGGVAATAGAGAAGQREEESETEEEEERGAEMEVLYYLSALLPLSPFFPSFVSSHSRG